MDFIRRHDTSSIRVRVLAFDMEQSNQSAERGSTPHRQKRRPGQQPPPRRSRAERDSSSSRKPRSHRHQSPSSSTAASSSHLRRKVSFDPGQQAPSRNVGLSRHQSFDPRLGRSARHQQDAAGFWLQSKQGKRCGRLVVPLESHHRHRQRRAVEDFWMRLLILEKIN